MTVKLFEENSLLKECEATVLSCIKADDHYEVLLDQTIIFPEGGGQLSDEGKIDDALVSFAKDGKEDVIHFTDKPLEEGKKVKVTLNWPVRLDHMQQHLGEHILSFAFWKLFGANNIGFHMNKDLVTIDLDKELTEEEVAKAEDFANMEIWEDKKVTVSHMLDTEVAKLTMRKKNEKLHGSLRIVAVENGDICTCCGTHPTSTGMIGSIKVFRFEKHKGGIRVEFGCGMRALKDAQMRYKAANDAGQILSVKVEDVPEGVKNLKNEIGDLTSRVKEKTLELFKEKLPKVLENAPTSSQGAKVICLKEECDAKSAKLLLQLLTDKENLAVGIFAVSNGRVNYQFAVTSGAAGDAKSYCDKANVLFAGKGGGSKTFAQGGGNITSTLDKDIEAVKEYMVKGE